MAKLLHFRNELSRGRFSLKDARDTFSLHCRTSRAGISTARQNLVADGKNAGRIFAPYSIYKGKAAFTAAPVLPTFTKTDTGGLRVDRRGTIMLTFSPAIGERKYDWEKKQMFALSATEVGSLLSLGSKDGCEFLHDPSMKSSNAGQVTKRLQIKAYPDGGAGYFVSLIVTNNILKTKQSLTVPVTTGEFAVMRAAFSFVLPHIMGWDRYTTQLPKSMDQNPSKVSPQLMDSEWDR